MGQVGAGWESDGGQSAQPRRALRLTDTTGSVPAVPGSGRPARRRGYDAAGRWSFGRSGPTVVSWLVAALVLAGIAFAVWGIWFRPSPGLEQSDAGLYQSLVDARLALTTDRSITDDWIDQVTTAPTSPTDPIWLSVVLAGDDPAVTQAQADASAARRLIAWGAAVTDPDITRMVTADQDTVHTTADGQTIKPFRVDFTRPPVDGATYRLTLAQVGDLARQMAEVRARLEATPQTLRDALGSAQKASALTGYQPAVDGLNAALATANALLTFATDHASADVASLSAAIAAADSVSQANSGIVAGDANSAQAVQAAIDALTAATTALTDATNQMVASSKDPRTTTMAGDPLPLSCASRGVGTNGCLDPATLCVVQNGQLLRCDAVDPFNRLSTAYAAQFGHGLYVDLAYRNYDAQVAMYQRYGSPRAATPGTSNHGWGLAIDLPDWETPGQYPPGWAAEIQYGTAQEDWLIANAPDCGWDFDVAGEPWHMDYTG